MQDQSKEAILERYATAVETGQKDEAVKAAHEALDAGLDPLEAIHQGGYRGLQNIGEQFERGKAFLPELMHAAEAMKASLEVLLQNVQAGLSGSGIQGKVVVGTCKGDIHDLGKNLVIALLSVNGFEVHDLGVDVPSRAFISKAEEIQADVIAISSLMTTSAYYQRDTIDYLNARGLRDRYYVMVGGGPITVAWASEIGADGYGRTALDAVTLCKRLLTERPTPPLSDPIAIGAG